MSRARTFAAYVVPSVLAFALSGIYAIVDGLFVGNSIGDIGLSAINVAYPVAALMQALGTGIGMGGAVMYSLRHAEGKAEVAGDYIRGTMLSLLGAGVIATVLLYCLMAPILHALGAVGDIFLLGQRYLRFIILGAILQVFGTGVVPLIRNQGGSAFAMFTMIAGFLTNIFLDYLFVWVYRWGMEGAAVATIIGQGITTIGAFLYLIVKKVPFWGLPRSIRLVLFQIARIGLAPFGIAMSPMVSLILMNRFSMTYGGEQAIASYACIAYVMTILYLLLQGVGDGSQPLISQYYGRGVLVEVRKIRTFAYCSAVVMATVCMVALFCTRQGIGGLFGASGTVAKEVAEALPIFLVSTLFLAFARITTSFFYATEQSMLSYVLVYAEPVLLFVLLLILPQFLGQAGVWWSMALSQILTAIMAGCLKIYADKRYLTGTNYPGQPSKQQNDERI